MRADGARGPLRAVVGEAARAQHVPPWGRGDYFLSGTLKWVPFLVLSRHASN